MTGEIAYLVKEGHKKALSTKIFYGNVGPQAVIVDDILDTGGTLVSCCEQLHSGVRDITILVTHGLFTGTLWQKLWGIGVKRIVAPIPYLRQKNGPWRTSGYYRCCRY